jgi:hypothetical protein
VEKIEESTGMRKIQIQPHLRQRADDLMRRFHRTTRDTSLSSIQESLRIIQTPNGDISSSAITLGGDVTGRGSNNTVVKLRNLPLPTPTTTDTILAFISGALAWIAIPDPTIPDHEGDVTGPHPETVVVGLQSTPVGGTAPSDAQVLAYSAALGAWTPTTLASSALGTRWEPVTNGDPDSPELIFENGDVVMEEVPL